MPDLLLLTHRLPYPPDKGDKIRSFHWLSGLAEHYRVHLGTFIDDDADQHHIAEVSRYCSSLEVIRLGRWATLGAALASLPRREPISIARYRSAALARWVDLTCQRHRIRAALAFSSGVGPYLRRPALGDARRVLDFVDVDSDKWRQYSRRGAYPKRCVYAREARLLARAEANLAEAVDASVLVSAEETALFATRIAAGTHLAAIGNGVDCGYFDPDRDYDDPYQGGRAVVFTGAMDYAANVDAVVWFAQTVWPLLRPLAPDAAFFIVGSRPGRAVRCLGAIPGIRVTGRVADIRPYIAHATVAVAPLRIARGIQNKVLEALAMDRPVVATPQAVEGLSAVAPCLDAVTDDAHGMAHALGRALAGDAAIDLGERRARVCAQYGWKPAVARLRALLEAPPSR